MGGGADAGVAGGGEVRLQAVARGQEARVVEVVVVDADGDAVRAPAAERLEGGEMGEAVAVLGGVGLGPDSGAGLVPDVEVPVPVLGSDFGGEGVDAGGAQPGVGPGVDVAFGGGGEVVDEVGEGGVGEPVAGEVGVDAGQEVLLAEPGDELAQGGGALGVGDAVEVEHGGRGVGDGVRVGGDGVGGGALVGVVAPGFAGDAEVGPGVGEAGGFGEGLVAHVLGEGLVQPDVVPPAQGDEVAEPHVGHSWAMTMARVWRSVSVTAER